MPRSSIEKVAALMCMDEANQQPGEHVGLLFGEKAKAAVDQFAFGLVASGIVQLEGGSPEKYPKPMRELFQRHQPALMNAFVEVANIMEAKSYVLAHVDCGGARAQGISGVAGATYDMCQNRKLRYGGYIERGHTPVRVGDSPVYACVDRPEKGRHVATAVVATIGGGISGSELRRELSNIGHKDAFLVSGEIFAHAVLYGGMSSGDAERMLYFQFDLADALVDGHIGSEISVHDARRLNRNSSSIKLVSNGSELVYAAKNMTRTKSWR